MKRGERPQGYTIVEVLIVIAVTGMLFASTAVLFQGRQATIQFTQSTRDFETKIRDTINEVTNGYYPNSTDYNCRSSVTGPDFNPTVSNEAGTNPDCIFIGKVIQFGTIEGNNCSGFPGGNTSDCHLIGVHSVAGLRKSSTGKDASTIVEAQAKVHPHVSEEYRLRYGLRISAVYQLSSTTSSVPTKVGGVGVISPFNQSDSLTTKGQEPRIIPMDNTALGFLPNPFYFDLPNKLIPANVNPSKGTLVCLRPNGDSNDRSAILIGGNNRTTTVEALFNETLDEFIQANPGLDDC